jgi:hypothetical protein
MSKRSSKRINSCGKDVLRAATAAAQDSTVGSPRPIFILHMFAMAMPSDADMPRGSEIVTGCKALYEEIRDFDANRA